MARTRRQFLIDTAASLSAVALPFAFPRGAWAGEDGPVIVHLFLRGAADCFLAVPPLGDPFYDTHRPIIRPDDATAFDLDGFFALHPAFPDLFAMFQAGDLAIVHAAGSPHPTRSHFEAQDFMERGVPGDKSVSDGWLNRYLGTLATASDPVCGISLHFAKTAALAGPVPTINFSSLARFRPPLPGLTSWASSVAPLYLPPAGSPAVLASITEALDGLDSVGQVSTQTSVTYPGTELGGLMKDAAALIKGRIGVRAISLGINGWDTHSNELANFGTSAARLNDALAAFQADLGAEASRTLTIVTSEFGRTAAENGGGGTEHGHGGVMFALGPMVEGGQVYTKNGVWPGMAPADLWEGRDLQVTTDFRDVFSEILDRHLGVSDPGSLFPGFTSLPSEYPGLLA